MTNDLATVEAPTNPWQQMLADAIQTGNAEVVERMAKVCREYDAVRAQREYNCAMNAAQAEIGPVVRTKWNDQNRCHYVADDDVDPIIRPIYTRHGFSLEFSSDTSPLENHYRCVCEISHNGGHTKHKFLDAPCDDKGMKGAPNKTGVQGVMSTMTYMKRNLKCLIFNIPIKGIDKDGQRSNGAVKYITAEQVATINDWMLQTETDLGRFLKWVSQEVGTQVASLDQMPVTLYSQAIQMFRDKVEKR